MVTNSLHGISAYSPPEPFLRAEVSPLTAGVVSELKPPEKEQEGDSGGLFEPNNAIVESSCEAYRPLIEQYGWDVEKMLKVCDCESGGNPEALNDNPTTKDFSIGLFQINLFGKLAEERPSKEYLLNAENNIDYAYHLFQRGGYRHWKACLPI